MKLKKKKKKATQRSPLGQALALSLPILFALASVGLGCFYLVWNLTTLAGETAQLDIVAREAARAILSDKYVMGMERQDFDLNTSKLKARALADQLLKGFGMSQTKTFDAEPDSITVDGARVEAIKVRFTAAVSPATPAHCLLGNNVIPQTVDLTGSGVANHCADSIANGLGILSLYNLDNPKRSHAFFFPIYNAELVNGNVQAGDPSYDKDSSHVATGSSDPEYSGWSAGDPAGITHRSPMPNSPGTVALTVGVRDNCDATTQGTRVETAGGQSFLW